MSSTDDPDRAPPHTELRAFASADASIYQAGRDQHFHYGSGVRHTAPGAAVSECPYPGLASFRADQARWFFGREELMAELVGLLDRRLASGGIQFVVAPSGAGKTSLLQAGLLPRLRNAALPGSHRWPVMVFAPTARPMSVLTARLSDFLGVPEGVGLRAGQGEIAVTLVRGELRARVGNANLATSRLVIIVDQFEELFTLCADEQERHAFINVLVQLASTRLALVVVGLRADCYAAAVNHPPLRLALQDQPLVVGPMSETQRRAAIENPARSVGLDIEPGLVELLLRDLSAGGSNEEAGRLPLLAHALRATWQQRHGHTLTVDGYRITGGIDRAVATTADNVFNGLLPAGQRIARSLFLRLIRLGDGVADARRYVSRAELIELSSDPATASRVLDVFTRARLLTQDRQTVRITHEALLRSWPRLREWINVDRAGNLLRQQIDEAATDWAREQHDSATLLRGGRLDTARTWASSHSAELTPLSSRFLAASVRQEHRATLRRRAAMAVLAVLMLLTSATAAYAFQQQGQARAERDDAVFNLVTAEADQLRATDPSLAAQLDVLAHRMRPTDPDTDTALLTTENTPLSIPITGHADTVRSVAFAPDGTTLASGGFDRTIRLWNDAAGPQPTARGAPLVVSADHVHSVAFSPDGHTMAAGSDDDTVRLWDVSHLSSPTALGRPLTGHGGTVEAVAFGPDGAVLASASLDRTIRLWDIRDRRHPALIGIPLNGTSGLRSVAFSPDGHVLAAGSNDGIQLWNITDPTQPVPLRRPDTGGGQVDSVAFSPDGRTLAGGGTDDTIRLWDVSDDAANPVPRTQPLTGHTAAVRSVAFSPDGHLLASGSDDQTIRLWNITDPTRPVPRTQPLTGHTAAVDSVAFSPDGHLLASGSEDHTIRLWNVPRTVLTGHTGPVDAVAASPDGHLLATGGADDTIRIWNIADGTRHPTAVGSPLSGHTAPVNALAFSPDGRILASASNDGTVRLWNADSGTPAGVLGQPGGDPVYGLAFGPRGHTLVTAGADRAFRTWNVADPTRPRALGPPVAAHQAAVTAVAYSPDGRTLATASDDETVRLWNMADPARPRAWGRPLSGHTDAIDTARFSSDGRLLAVGASDHSIVLWDTSNPAHASLIGPPLSSQTNVVHAVVFADNQPLLASADQDGTIRLWDVSRPRQPRQWGTPLAVPQGSVNALAVVPHTDIMASTGDDRTVYLWDLDIGAAIRRICASTRNLTPPQWQRYVGDLSTYAAPCGTS